VERAAVAAVAVVPSSIGSHELHPMKGSLHTPSNSFSDDADHGANRM